MHFSIYYATQAELTLCFIVTCLPSMAQIVSQTIWPFVRSHVSYPSLRKRSEGSKSESEAHTPGPTAELKGGSKHGRMDSKASQASYSGPPTMPAYTV